MRRLALALLLLLTLLPAWTRRLPVPARSDCRAEGRGTPPRHWLGCAADGGARRDLRGEERILLGRPLDLNASSASELAWVPGLTPRLAAEVEAERARSGPFSSVDDLLRVDGIGPKRLARARPWVAVSPAPVGVAEAGE